MAVELEFEEKELTECALLPELLKLLEDAVDLKEAGGVRGSNKRQSFIQ